MTSAPRHIYFSTAARPLASHVTLAEIYSERAAVAAVQDGRQPAPHAPACNSVIFANCMWDPSGAATPTEAVPCPNPAEWLTQVDGRARFCADCDNNLLPGCWDCDPLTVAFCDRCYRAMADNDRDVVGWRI